MVWKPMRGTGHPLDRSPELEAKLTFFKILLLPELPNSLALYYSYTRNQSHRIRRLATKTNQIWKRPRKGRGKRNTPKSCAARRRSRCARSQRHRRRTR